MKHEKRHFLPCSVVVQKASLSTVSLNDFATMFVFPAVFFPQELSGDCVVRAGGRPGTDIGE